MEGAGTAADNQEDFDEYYTSLQQKHDAEMEFYTELAVRETQRWIEEVTKRKFGYSEDAIKSLEDGILLCELLNAIRPGSVKRINRLVSSKMAKMDNVAVFLDACRKRFGLRVEQLFDVSDLHAAPDATSAADDESNDSNSIGAKRERDRRLRNVAVTVFWLARQLNSARGTKYAGPDLDFAAFAPLVAAKASGPQPDDWSPADFDEQVDYDSDMSSLSSRDRSMLASSQPDDRSRWRSSGGERFPSMDSLDDYGSGSGRVSAGAAAATGEHRRMQSSDSLDSGCGERASGGGIARKGSSSALTDPLQFVQLKPAVNLARTAEETLRRAEAAKVLRQNIDKGEEEWQGNLSSWKQKRKSQSSSNLFSSVDPAEVIGSAPQSRGSSSNYHRYPYDDQPVDDQPADDLDDSAFHSVVPSLDATMADEPAPPRRRKSDSDFGSCSPKDDGNNDADLESEGGCSEDGNYGQQYAHTGGTVSSTADAASKWTVPSRVTTLAKNDSQASGKMRLTLKPPASTDDGFGFAIKGGVDKCAPITVETVVKGSPAEEAGLAETDEVLEIGKEVVNNRSRGYCMLLINNALKKQARLDLVVQRDAQRVAQALFDKKRSSLNMPKSIFDVYEGIATEQPLAATIGNRLSNSDETAAVKVAAAAVVNSEPSEQSGGSTHNRSISTEAAAAAGGSRETLLVGISDKRQPPDMQSAVDSSAVYTSFVQLRLSSGSAEPDNQTVDASTADLSPGSYSRAQSRTLQAEEEDKKRMADWAHEQELQQQRQYEADQRALREQFEKDKSKAEELAILSRQKEREAARDRATKKLLELKSRFSSEAPDGGGSSHVNGTERDVTAASSTTSDRRSSVEPGAARAAENLGHAQRAAASGLSSKEEELRRKELELRQMEEDSADSEERLLQEQQRILQEQQRLLQMREEQRLSQQPQAQQELQPDSDRLAPQVSMGYSSSPLPDDHQPSTAPARSSRGGITPTAAPAVTTPSMSDVYKHYETTQLPEQLGARDLTPPRLTRKEVMDMSRKATAATESRLASGKQQQHQPTPTDRARPPLAVQQQQQHQAPSLTKQGNSVGKQASSRPQQQGHSSQGGRAATLSYDTAPQKKAATVSAAGGTGQQRSPPKDAVDSPLVKAKAATLDRPLSSSKQKTVDLDPSMPSVVSKEDVLRLTREKPRYMRRAEQQQRKDQSDDSYRGGGGSVHPLRKCISGFDMRSSDLTDSYSGNRLTEAGSDEALNKSVDFRTSRALFEQQGREADTYWKQRQQQQDEQRRVQPAATRPALVKSRTLDRPTSKTGAWKSGAAPAKSAGNRVSSWIASTTAPGGSAAPAQTEWRKELESVRQARQQQMAADDDEVESDDVGGAREKERRLREERNRELAAIRQLSRGGGSSTPDSEVAAGSSDREEGHWRRGEAQMSFESDQSSSKNSLPEYWQQPTAAPPPQQQYSQRSAGVDSDERRHQQQQLQQVPQLASQTRHTAAVPAAAPRAEKSPSNATKHLSPAADGGGRSHAGTSAAGARPRSAAEPARPTAALNGRVLVPAAAPMPGSRDQQPAPAIDYYADQPQPYDDEEEADRELLDDEDEAVLSVSAKQQCAYCSQELGRGAAMVIESLNMCYHVDCFRCWACRQPLSDGARGADVRVRDNRLHCKECYDNNNSVSNGQLLAEDDTFL